MALHTGYSRGGAALVLLLLPALAMLLAGCEPETKTKAPEARPVRTVTVEKSDVGELVVLTGQINAENEAALAFRIGGRIIERLAGVGDRVEPDQVLAKLDPQNELNALRSAQAALSAAQGQLVEASNTFDRQNHLLERGFTTKVLFDQAQQTLRTAQSRVDDAQAQLQIAEDRVSYTQLKANVTGAITARGAESGEVVQPGQMVFQGCPAGWTGRRLRRTGASDTVSAARSQDRCGLNRRTVRDGDGARAASRSAGGPVTRTFRVRVSLIDPPAAMLLGATVTGTHAIGVRPSHLNSSQRPHQHRWPTRGLDR